MKNGLSQLLNTNASSNGGHKGVEYSFLNEGITFPLVVKPKDLGIILGSWIKENKLDLQDKLNKHGAILFRGFHVDTVQKFQNFITAFDELPLEYKNRSSPRFEVAKNIYHSTTYPEDQSINMHSENSYALSWAMKIVFCCIQPAEEQGETPISDNRLFLSFMSPLTKEKFLNKGVKYVRNLSNWFGLSWQEVFQTNERIDVEKECITLGMNYFWGDDDSLKLTWNNKAVHSHPFTNQNVWFNHSYFFNKYTLDEETRAAFDSDDKLPFNTYYGDGTEISENEINEIKSAYEKSSIVFPWEKGDVLLMDNMLMAHGRKPYKGDRKIIVSMFQPMK